MFQEKKTYIFLCGRPCNSFKGMSRKTNIPTPMTSLKDHCARHKMWLFGLWNIQAGIFHFLKMSSSLRYMFPEENWRVSIITPITTPSTVTSRQMALHKKFIKINSSSAASCNYRYPGNHLVSRAAPWWEQSASPTPNFPRPAQRSKSLERRCWFKYIPRRLHVNQKSYLFQPPLEFPLLHWYYPLPSSSQPKKYNYLWSK